MVEWLKAGKEKKMSRRVVVTGMGAITPIGLSVEEFWNSVKEGKIGFGEITRFDTTDFKSKLAAEVKGFEGKNYMDFKAAKRMELFSQYAVAAAKEAIEDARKNAKINNIDNAEFFVGKAEEVVPKMYKEYGLGADVVVVDPPRKGCDEKLLETMISMSPEKIVYVSCDSATLARDLEYLKAHGYGVKKVQPVDMFPHSVHVETVVLMSKVK